MPTKTWSSGNTLTAADMNTYVRDLGVNAACLARADGLQTVVNDTEVKVTYVTEDYDTDAIHNTGSNQSRFTPVYSGYYVLSGFVQLTANAGGSYRQVAVWKNNSAPPYYGLHRRLAWSTVWDTFLTVVGLPVFCNGSTDYLEVVARQNSGSTLTVTQAVVSCHRLRG